MKKHIAILAFAAFATLGLASCKNRANDTEVVEPGQNQATATPQTNDLDVVSFAKYYCKTTDLDKARIFQGKDTSSLFTIREDIENNYAIVYANTEMENSLEFYMWTDKDGEKILGVNVTEFGEKGHNRSSLQFFTFDSRLNLVVPCKRLNEIITNKMMTIRKGLAKFILRIPTSPENENITLQYWDRKDNYTECIFVWDGKQFKV